MSILVELLAISEFIGYLLILITWVLVCRLLFLLGSYFRDKGEKLKPK